MAELLKENFLFRVAFVSTDFEELPSHYQGSHLPEEPLDILYAMGAVRGVEARYVKFDPAGIEYLQAADAVVVSTTNSYLQWNNHPLGLHLFGSVMQKVRKASSDRAKVLVFGPHVPAHHEDIYEIGADFVVLGEAELVIAGIIEYLEGSTSMDEPVFPGLVPRGATSLPQQAVVVDLDKLPTPAYEAVLANDYNAHNHPEAGTLGHLYEASRGCPYMCDFCNTITHRREHRVKSVEKIRSDLAVLAQVTERKYVYFIDESFGFRKAWFDELMPVLTELPFEFGCQGNLSFATKEKLDSMVQAGFVNVEFGYETANESIVKGIGKNNRMKGARDLINHSASIGLNPILFAQVGLPGETAESLRQSVEFMRGLDSRVRVSIAMTTPYRDTAVWRQGVETGVIQLSVKGEELYGYSGRVGHELKFDQEAAQAFSDVFGPNHHLTADFLDELEASLTRLFTA